MANDSLRAEHDAVLLAVSTRVSTHHFAHAAVSTLLSGALGATAVKLWLDHGEAHPEWSLASGIACALVLAYALVRLALGARANTSERAQQRRLKELRLALGVDAPASVPRPS